MKDLLTYLIKEITGSEDFEVGEDIQGDKVNLTVKADSSVVGLIIGKEGKTIKALRKILSVRATNEKTVVSITIL